MSISKVRTSVETFLAFSKNAQAAYGTVLPSDTFTLMHDHQKTRVKEIPKKVNNRDMVGKGHENATRIIPISIDTKLPVSVDMSSMMAAWISAFGCGSVTISQPDPSGSPDVYEILAVPMNIYDPLVGKQLPATSILQQKGDTQKVYRDLVMSDFSISGKYEEQLKAECNFVGSGFWQVPSPAIELPDLALVEFLLTHGISFKIADNDVSAELLDFKFSHKNTLAEKTGYHPGSPAMDFNGKKYQCKGNCLISKRETELEFRMIQTESLVDVYNDMLEAVARDLVIKATGGQIDDSYNHTVEIGFGNVFFDTVDEGNEEDFDTYDVKCLISWDDTENRPFYIKTTTNMTGFLTTPA